MKVLYICRVPLNEIKKNEFNKYISKANEFYYITQQLKEEKKRQKKKNRKKRKTKEKDLDH